DNNVLAALQDRIYVVQYEPTDAQIIALMGQAADEGVRGIDPHDGRLVLNFLLEECQHRGIRPSMRLFVEKAIPDFQMHSQQQCQLDWRDLIIANLEQQLIEPEFPTRDLSRTDALAVERRTAQQILRHHESASDRVAAWRAETGKSQATFYRRVKEVQLVMHAADL
ncbi:MAG TPA: hypothetical protein VM165_21495, partial [Planctomycetaceae bacterium]|nr:hypothetical protein [Planctomycetaceae bacterium]